MLQVLHHAQNVGVVVEPTVVGHDLIKRRLARVAEWRMTKIVGQGNRLGQVLVGLQADRQGAGDLRDLERVGQPGAKVVVKTRREDLRLSLEPSEGRALDDAVSIPLERAEKGVRRLRVRAVVGLAGDNGEGGEAVRD